MDIVLREPYGQRKPLTPIRCAEPISAIGHTGHSEEIHSPDE
jgi:hypothetical protein